MKLSKYTLYKHNFPRAGYSLLYSTLTKAVSILPTDEFNMIGGADEASIKDLDLLKSQGFVVNTSDDERSKLNMYFTGIKCNYYSYATMIYTTYDCNMRCPYCFENGIKNNRTSMSTATAQDVVSWLEKEITQYQPKYFSIAFSGGEPLLNTDVIKLIVSGMKSFCDKNAVIFQFGLLTNGTVSISDEDADYFQKHGISFIQYTIDGDEGVHNRRRVLGGGSYKTIIDNIRENAGKMSIQSVVRTNIDRDNHDSIEQMLIDLKSLNIDGLVTDFAVRFETPCDKYHSNVSVADNKTVSNYIKECMYLSKRIGIPHSRRYASDTPCLAIVPRQFVIDPVGDLYKCAAFAGEKAYSVGSIYDEQMYDVYVDMVGHDAWQDCRDCPYVPLCGGGCLFLNRTATGNFKTRKCQRTLFESLVMETIASTLNVEDLQKRIEEVNNG